MDLYTIADELAHLRNASKCYINRVKNVSANGRYILHPVTLLASLHHRVSVTHNVQRYPSKFYKLLEVQ